MSCAEVRQKTFYLYDPKATMNKTILSIILLLTVLNSTAQEETTDSSLALGEVVLRAFELQRSSRTSTAAVRIIERNNGDRYNKTSLVQGMNTVTGVRMEERSPGSYRINIRGSSLRSPFGVRNVKVYWNGIPVTDPGGNTYFNQVAWNNFTSMEIFKGPVGSLYGAGTGGLILMHNLERFNHGASLEYVGGSFNTHNILAGAGFGSNTNKNQVSFAHNESDGYRLQSASRRDNFSWNSQVRVSEKHSLYAAFLFTDLYYQTPGALTAAEFAANPRAARPAAGAFPSAIGARAAIHQKNVLAGINNEYAFNAVFSNTTVLYGAFAHIRNPAIRNYETRNEPHYGGRSFFTWKKKDGRNDWTLITGGEYQEGLFNIQVAENLNGEPDTLQSNDDAKQRTYNVFLQGDAAIDKKWFITAGVSLTNAAVTIARKNNYPVVRQTKKYRNEISPRIAVLRNWDHTGIRFSVSRGFSPPTTAEVLPSTGVISTELEAEHGWNYEAMVRTDLLKNKLQLELIGFYFHLKNALVQRRDLSGADFFINAGDVRQKGFEFHADYFLSAGPQNIIDYLVLRGDYTFHYFRYGDYVKGTDDFSGNDIPSVPQHALSFLADINFKKGFYLNVTAYGASKIFLNDANTAQAEPYQLLDSRLGYKRSFKNQHIINVYVGANNLTDEKYSLGNDINAPAGRFFNAAAGRNYYAGVGVEWRKKKDGNVKSKM
jgi:iron complex outermembrane receptor protein